MSFSPDIVLGLHRQAMEERLVTSVIPVETGIDMDPGVLTYLAGALGAGTFSENGLLHSGPKNLVKGNVFRFMGGSGLVGVEFGLSAPTENRELIEEVGLAISSIDRHFRTLTGVPDTTETTPYVNLFCGVFTGKIPTDRNKHLDFGGRKPVVSYKMYFEGPPEHSSYYYPGNLRLPNRWQALGRAIGGIDPRAPIQRDSRKDRVTETMPSRVVCLEPWNAFHSGPTARGAIGTTRGILDVVYNLRQTHPHLAADMERRVA